VGRDDKEPHCRRCSFSLCLRLSACIELAHTDKCRHAPAPRTAIALFDNAVLAVRAADGAISIVVADLCTALPHNRSSHVRAIRDRIGWALRTLDNLTARQVQPRRRSPLHCPSAPRPR